MFGAVGGTTFQDRDLVQLFPFVEDDWEYFGAKFDWIHDGKIGAIRYASGISARSFHADTLLKDTAKPWRGAVR